MAAIRHDQSNSRCEHDVFLSFRGIDTRKRFITHLRDALERSGIKTFMDDKELPTGEDITPQLLHAIQASRAYIIVFSQNYASSTWCLEELVEILECKRSKAQQQQQHLLFPIYYGDVRPSVLRHLTGSYGEAFRKHTARVHLLKVQKWRAALQEVADLRGHVLDDEDNGDESKFIYKVVNVMQDKLRSRKVFSATPYLVGIHSRTSIVNLWLQDGSTDVGLMVIWGMGGIGKTTIAKFAFNQNFDSFGGSSFLENIRERSKDPKGLVHIQKQFLSDICKRKREKIHDTNEGINKIMDAIRCKKILLVLDDVDHVYQLNALIGMRDRFYRGSKIIITTRNKRLLKPHEIYDIHKVEELGKEDSEKLFNFYAFGQHHPTEKYVEYTKKIVAHCGGLPLALQVLGSSLAGKDVDVWVSQLKKLETIADGEIVEKLKISFDSLQDDDVKNIFLHIACIFDGTDKDCTVSILDACGMHTIVGIEHLIDRSLLEIEPLNKLKMHQSIRDMGRDIVSQQSLEPEKRSVLWHPDDCFGVLREKSVRNASQDYVIIYVRPILLVNIVFSLQQGTETIKAMAFDMRMCKKISQRRASKFPFFTMRDANEYIESDAFARMKRLQLLQLNYVKLRGSYKQFPKKLSWLCWHGFDLESIPSDLSMECLVSLDMQHSSLKKLWNGPKFLPSLKIINLSHSQQLARSPNISSAPNLERMILKGCVSLVDMHKSISLVEKLVLLDLEDCRSLRKLPENISNLRFLESLIISGCTSLREFPTSLRNMASLKVIFAHGIKMNALLSPRGQVQNWASLPQSLVSLSLHGCNLSDNSFPRDFSHLPSLELLDLTGNLIVGLPDCVRTLNRLKILSLVHCPMLQSITGLPKTLVSMFVVGNPSLVSVTTPPNLTDIMFSYCENVVELKGCFKSAPLGNVDITTKRNLGLIDLQSRLSGHAEMKLFHGLTVNYEFGIYSTLLHGSEIPDGFNYRSQGSSISFIVPSFPSSPPISGLNVCFVTEALHWWTYPWTRISNKTKDINWIYGSHPSKFPNDSSDFMMLSYWKLGGNLIEGGDEVTVSCEDTKIKVKECGIKIVYSEKEREEETKEMSQQQDIVHLSWAEETLTHLSQFHDTGTSYYFGDKYRQQFPEIDVNRVRKFVNWYGECWDSFYGYKQIQM